MRRSAHTHAASLWQDTFLPSPTVLLLIRHPSPPSGTPRVYFYKRVFLSRARIVDNAVFNINRGAVGQGDSPDSVRDTRELRNQ